MSNIKSDLERLKNCHNQKDLAELLGYSEKQLTNILFSRNICNRYHEFSIPKKSGSNRHILAPDSDLKALQSKTAQLLSNCYNEIEVKRVLKTGQQTSILSFSAHGFRKSLEIEPFSREFNFNIYSNAKNHINKKYVLNIDIEDFFESITFRRVRGYLSNNRDFLLDYSIAQIIAQIATYKTISTVEGYLPQGSPLSPIISNLISSILDNKILKLAKRYKLDYSRYADDITLSTNIPTFPSDIAHLTNNKWLIGSKLLRSIESSGFKVNKNKTRLYTRGVRQGVTSLSVNKKVNISKKYYRYTRTMVNAYCSKGSYSKSSEHRHSENNSESSLNGILSYIYYIKKDRCGSEKNISFRDFEELDSIEKLYVKFLFHYYFIYPERMIIIGEGYTDPLHLKLACDNLSNTPNKFFKFTYLGDTKRFADIMGFKGGTGLLNKFLKNYKLLDKSNVLSKKPCVILLDGDKAGDSVIRQARNVFEKDFKKIYIQGKKNISFYHVYKNLYLFQLEKEKDIEDLYEPKILESKIGNRTFYPSNSKTDQNIYYGKREFFEKIVQPNQALINFDNFNYVLDTLYSIQFYHFIYWLASRFKNKADPA